MGLFDLFRKKQPEALESIIAYSEVDSNEKAESLHAKGKLVKLYLVSPDFGGEDSPLNILYVPESANEQKKIIDARIVSLLKSGLKLSYSANPEYKGKSFVPSRIVIRVSGDQNYSEVLNIW